MAQPPFGPPMQLGFVVPDLPAAIRHWVSLGVGPFFLLEHIDFAECRYRGRPANFDLSVAVGQWGAVQVELIRQHDAVPSIYTEFDGSRAGGLQHVGVMTDSVAADLERLGRLGIEAVQSGSTANGIRFAYVNTDTRPGGHPGGMVELIERGPVIDGFFKLVRESAVGWDGSDPVRRPG
jgi:hypothetical protein